MDELVKHCVECHRQYEERKSDADSYARFCCQDCEDHYNEESDRLNDEWEGGKRI